MSKCHKCHSEESLPVYLLRQTHTDTVRHNIDEEVQAVQEQWLSPEQAAQYLGVNRSTIYKWAREGRFVIRRLSGRASRINRAELNRMIDSSESVYPREDDHCGTR